MDSVSLIKCMLSKEVTGVLQEILVWCFFLSWIRWIIPALRKLCRIGNMYSDKAKVIFQAKIMNGLDWSMCINSQCFWDPARFLCLSCLLWDVFSHFSNSPWTWWQKFTFMVFQVYLLFLKMLDIKKGNVSFFIGFWSNKSRCLPVILIKDKNLWETKI